MTTPVAGPRSESVKDLVRANPSVAKLIDDFIRLTRPQEVVYCDGSSEQRAALTTRACLLGVLEPLDQQTLPGCYYHRSDPGDVARLEGRTFICTPDKEEVGPNNNHMDPFAAHALLEGHMKDAMRGRALYVVPCVMGPATSPYSKVGIQLTDSVYVALSLDDKMSRVGCIAATRFAAAGADVMMGLHCTLDVDPGRRYICHFPYENLVISTSSNYGGNALIPKKCFALRLASWQARREGWLAEHMMLLEVESPAGERRYVAGAFPSACGKTNFAMLRPTGPYAGWKVRTIGDDIAWLHVGDDGRLWAINPENGYFGVAKDTSEATNPNAMATIRRNTIYTNVAQTLDGGVWWKGKCAPPERLVDWLGDERSTSDGGPDFAHPNARFCVNMHENPVCSPFADAPEGVPIDAIVFGGRRADTVPLVLEAFDWAHGVLMGATLASEKTAAAEGKVGELRRDPFAMLPFCGYHMGDYFAHWLDIGARLTRPPKIFTVNWFRRDSDGEFIWPGYSENMRVLEWMLSRAEDSSRPNAERTPVGRIPSLGGLLAEGIPEAVDIEGAIRVIPDEWRVELAAAAEYLAGFGERPPAALTERLAALQRNLAPHSA